MQAAAVEAAPAKVNLALHVTGRRPDGYHTLESLVVFTELGDELEATPAPSDTLRIAGPFADAVGNGDTNLVLRAVRAFREKWPGSIPEGLSLSLHKNLPVAAGLGGGSADAAAALRIMATLSSAPISDAGLQSLALSLGADVPACVVSRPLELGGTGESIRALESFPPCHLVLINPLIPVVTAEVFRRLAHHDHPGLPPFATPFAKLPLLAMWLEETRNDLEPPAILLAPIIADLATTMRQRQGCILARMSGSGATVFGLFGSGAQAHQAAHDLREMYPDYWVAAAPVIQP
jgi:4-diphosphocytidyl-2-C-methyl-D-erythritol kinase